MQADKITVQLDNARDPRGHTDREFSNAQYDRVWNGVNVTAADGTVEFFDNVEVVGFHTYSKARH
jgi:hypothetical protein